ncbi:hypothetical protein ColTof4_03174 [Colletotrichum tofieldiae]|nr:hypothetical protein ColTof3_13415 [Colletotrichum tofieldiae]GKT70751.1 hypothetical protein ColTof4_03174 [Colletotrichum tofieldiae]
MDPNAQIAGPPRPGWPYFKHPAGLNKFDGCKILTKTYCGGTDGYLQWRFQRWVSCNPGMIASSWFDTTKNQLGFLDCEAKQPDVQPEEEDDG